MSRSNRSKKKDSYPENISRDNVEVGYIPNDFIEYYKKQLIPNSLNEIEFEEFLNYLKISLTHVFRLSKLSPTYENLKFELNEHFEIIRKLGFSAHELDFIDDKFGSVYKLSVDKPTMRKNKELHQIREWLNSRSETGDCNRQELVSMLPPYFLEVKPNDSILDCCASPGSKTSQVTEMLLSQTQHISNGLLVANDVDPERCRTLIHQLNRFESPHVIVTCHPAQQLPDLPSFDRIICDVPCSGDGTFRKNPDASRKWKSFHGRNLHPLQRAILIKAINLLKIGGRLVYSTCSLNPIENEAVINSVLLEFGNSISLINVSNILPKLKRSKGLTNWYVFGDEGIYNSYESIPNEFKQHYSSSMFSNNISSNLENCMRFYPQQNDSGGFFVAVIEKNSNNLISNPLPFKHLSDWRQPPFIPLIKNNNEVYLQLKEEYGLDNSFNPNSLFIRAEESVRNIFYLY